MAFSTFFWPLWFHGDKFLFWFYSLACAQLCALRVLRPVPCQVKYVSKYCFQHSVRSYNSDPCVLVMAAFSWFLEMKNQRLAKSKDALCISVYFYQSGMLLEVYSECSEWLAAKNGGNGNRKWNLVTIHLQKLFPECALFKGILDLQCDEGRRVLMQL